jgi:lipopolysaccharide biosynthesis glycosyltransferase
MTHEQNSKRLNLPKSSPYINSGVLVLNLKKMREKNIENKFFNFVEKNNFAIRNVDQDVINLVLHKENERIMLIRQNWNTEVRSDIKPKGIYTNYKKSIYNTIHY